MNALTTSPLTKKIIGLLPEIWFTFISAMYLLLVSANLVATGWTAKSSVLPAVLLLIIGILIKQFVRKGSWARFLLGMFFAICSFFVFMATLYEYREFPLKTDPEAIKLIVVGCGLAGLSLALAIKMLMSGLHKIYSW